MPPNPEDSVVGEIAPLARLALSYAPRAARLPTLALLALDARCGGIVRRSHEPMLAQLRLAWWREQLSADDASWPEGEPLLAALRSWQGAHGQLAALVDGWEALTGAAPLPHERIAQFAAGRGAAFAALASVLGTETDAAEARRTGREWALADLAGKLSDPRERDAAGRLIGSEDWSRARLPRALRPLAVLHGLARAAQSGGEARQAGPRTVAAAMRIGLLGR